uniref:Uncharacterized protein n=1 Tax=Anopheles atroparvus TaxID=41427 RepID=A0AAG5CV99_ANOAO
MQRNEINDNGSEHLTIWIWCYTLHSLLLTFQNATIGLFKLDVELPLTLEFDDKKGTWCCLGSSEMIISGEYLFPCDEYDVYAHVNNLLISPYLLSI